MKTSRATGLLVIVFAAVGLGGSSAPPQTRVDDSGRVVPIKPSDIIGQAGNQEQKSELNGQ